MYQFFGLDFLKKVSWKYEVVLSVGAASVRMYDVFETLFVARSPVS